MSRILFRLLCFSLLLPSLSSGQAVWSAPRVPYGSPAQSVNFGGRVPVVGDSVTLAGVVYTLSVLSFSTALNTDGAPPYAAAFDYAMAYPTCIQFQVYTGGSNVQVLRFVYVKD